MKKYLVVWGAGYALEKNVKAVSQDAPEFFTEYNGFTADMIEAIQELDTGESVTLRDLSGPVSVVRID